MSDWILVPQFRAEPARVNRKRHRCFLDAVNICLQKGRLNDDGGTTFAVCQYARPPVILTLEEHGEYLNALRDSTVDSIVTGEDEMNEGPKRETASRSAE